MKVSENTAALAAEIAQIWVVDLSLGGKNLIAYHDLLSNDERQRANSFKFAKDRNKFIVCRAVLRKLSSKYLKMKPQDIVFNYAEFGKPYFGHETLINFNVSHSGNLAVIGFVENQTIGIDIELLKQDFDVSEIARSFFSKREIQALDGMTKEIQYLGFYRCWTRKEAFIKAEGSGLSFPLDSFAVSIDSDETASLQETNWNLLDKDRWYLYPFAPAPNYRAAMAVKGKLVSVSVQQWNHT